MDEEWKIWKSQHAKQYTEEEEIHRRKIWEHNVRRIEQHNLEYSMGKHTFTMGTNQFADLTSKEFSERMCGSLPFEAVKSTEEAIDEDIEFDEDKGNDDDLSNASVDWRANGAVTPVKNQSQPHPHPPQSQTPQYHPHPPHSQPHSPFYFCNQGPDCGSCWAFSATGAIEGQWKLKHGNLVSLSEQNLVDCDRKSNGCKSGNPIDAFQYVIKKKGTESERSYPYTAVEGKCRFQKGNVAATIRSISRVQANETALEQAVRDIGPISVSVDTKPTSFQCYKQGIYYEKSCDKGVTHAMLMVGYGTENNTNYWLVKNRQRRIHGMNDWLERRMTHWNRFTNNSGCVY